MWSRSENLHWDRGEIETKLKAWHNLQTSKDNVAKQAEKALSLIHRPNFGLTLVSISHLSIILVIRHINASDFRRSLTCSCSRVSTPLNCLRDQYSDSPTCKYTEEICLRNLTTQSPLLLLPQLLPQENNRSRLIDTHDEFFCFMFHPLWTYRFWSLLSVQTHTAIVVLSQSHGEVT